MDWVQRIGRNTLYQLIGKLISALSTFLILGLVARKFGEGGVGEFTLILSYIALFYLFADFGLNALVVKKMVEEEKKASFYFQNLFGLRLIFAFCLILLSSFVAQILPYFPTFKLGVVAVSLTILTQSIFTTTNAFFQSRLRYDQSVLASSLGRLTTLLLIYLFSYRNLSLITLLFAYPLGGIVMATTSLFFIRRAPFITFPSFNRGFWRLLLVTTLPLSLTLLVDLLHFKIDTFLLAYFRPIEEVGVYNLAYKIFENILVFPVFFVNSVYPLLVERHTRGVKKFASTIKTALIFLLTVSFLISVFSFFLAPLIIRFLAGGGFLGSILTLRILSLSLPAFFTTALLMWVLITVGEQWLLFKIYFLAMVLDLVLNLVFIPKFGFLASAVTTGVTEGLVLALEGWFVFRLLQTR